MKFGIFEHMDTTGLPLREQIATRLSLIAAYDRLGFYAYHLAEHHGTPLGLAPSPGIFLAAVAQHTRRIRLGPLVYCLPLYHPLRLIEEICMLDHMSGGRFELGVGRGVSPIEVRFFGVNPTSGPRQFAEALAVIRKGLTSESLTHHGEFYHFDEVPMVLQPLQRPHPRLWQGVGTPEAAERAAANNASIVMLLPASAARVISDRYRAAWQGCGHADGNNMPLIGLSRHMVLAENEADARAVAQRAYCPWRRNMELLWLRHGVPFPLPLPHEFEPLRQHRGAFAGTPDAARAYIAEQVESAGANCFVCDVAFGDIRPEEAMRTVELLAAHILPGFIADGDSFDQSL
jgi:alkanesulfonate monooxygenase SsuD/methylene tetrahydromethanopterin reductase-like flavin-dependent oxidoreductase (luciferase family)